MDRWSSLPWFARLTFPSVVRNDSFPPQNLHTNASSLPTSALFLRSMLVCGWVDVWSTALISQGSSCSSVEIITRNRSPRNHRKPALEPRAALLRMRSSRSECGFLKLLSQNALCVLERKVNSHWTANVVCCNCFLGDARDLSYRGRFTAQKPESALSRVQIPRRFLVIENICLLKNCIFLNVQITKIYIWNLNCNLNSVHRIIIIFKSSISQHN